MNKNIIIKSSFILVAIVFVSAFALSHVYKITKPSIMKQQAEKEQNAISVVLPGFTIGEEQRDESENGSVFRYWKGEKENENKSVTTAYAFIAENYGYSGLITSLVGVSDDGKIMGIYIISQTETPGLGARSVEVSGGATIWDIGKLITGKLDNSNLSPWFQGQFVGLSLGQKIAVLKIGEWSEDKRQTLLDSNGISAITGATITSRAVVASVERGYARLSSILEHKKEPLEK